MNFRGVFVFGYIIIPYLTPILFVVANDYKLLYSHKHFANAILKNAKDWTISKRCKEELLDYGEALQYPAQQWALQMFDAGTKIPSGLFDGYYIDFGRFDECMGIEKNVTSDRISGKYCLGTLKLNEPFIFATCLPSACSSADMSVMYNQFFIPANFLDFLCQTKSDQPEFDKGDLLMTIVCCAILFFVLLSTGYETVIYFLQKKPHHPILVAFALSKNVNKLLEVRKNEGISCIHGIRVISAFWIILHHKYVISSVGPSDNFLKRDADTHRRYVMMLANVLPVLDTFFMVGGLLLVFSFLIEQKRKIRFNVFSFYVRRYLRLTPLIVVIMAFYLTVLKHAGSGPLWPNVIKMLFIEPCQKHWWAALLHIQNYKWLVDQPCILQSWYVSIDYQLYLLSPFLLIPLLWWPLKTLFFVAILIATLISGVFASTWSLKIVQWNSLNSRKGGDFIMYYRYAIWVWAVPWLAGFILGYILSKSKEKTRVMVINGVCRYQEKYLHYFQALRYLMWVGALGVMYLCVFQPYDMVIGKLTQMQASADMAFSRLAWSIALGWIIYTCFTGHGGVFNWFLSLPIFQVLSKLTYGIFLSHLTILLYRVGRARYPTWTDDIQFWHEFCGDAIFSTILSVVLVLAIEMPILNLERFLWNR